MNHICDVWKKRKLHYEFSLRAKGISARSQENPGRKVRVIAPTRHSCSTTAAVFTMQFLPI